MEIHYFNRSGSTISVDVETHNINPYMLLCDHLEYDCNTASMILFYDIVDVITHYELIFLRYESSFPQEPTPKIVKFLRDHLFRYKKLLNQKFRSKDDLVFMGRYKTLLASIRKSLKMVYEDWMKRNSLMGVYPFGIDESLYLEMSTYLESENMEEFLLTAMVKSMLKKNIIIALDKDFENQFQFNEFNIPIEEKIDFIKIHVCDLPPTLGLSFEQMKHIKMELNMALKTLTSSLNELQERFPSMIFNEDSVEEIRQLCFEKINPCLEPLKLAIDDSLYLTKLRSEFSRDNILRFCLGVTSVGNIIDFYEKQKVLEPPDLYLLVRYV